MLPVENPDARVAIATAEAPVIVDENRSAREDSPISQAIYFTRTSEQTAVR
jgi:hypothetical protein